MKTERIALIDGDILVYRAAAHIAMWETDEGEVYPLKKEASKHCANPVKIGEFSPPLATVKEHLDAMITNIVTDTMSISYRVFLTEEGEATNFRRAFAVTAPYKGHRKSSKPTHYLDAREHLCKAHHAEVSMGEEADDLMGIAHSSPHTQTVYCSSDKDRYTIPGLSYDPFTGVMEHVNEKQAIEFFYKQILMGDKADNIPGLRGIGPKKAAEIVKNFTDELDLYRKVCYTYSEKLRVPIEEAKVRVLEMGRLLKIRTVKDEIWSPPE